jgi:hypothetical protein
VPNIARGPIEAREKPLTSGEVFEPKATAVERVVFELAWAFVGPAMESVDNTLESLQGHFVSEGAVAKCDLKRAIDIVSKALILPKHLQDGGNGGQCVLGPSMRVSTGEMRMRKYSHFGRLHKFDQELHNAMPT